MKHAATALAVAMLVLAGTPVKAVKTLLSRGLRVRIRHLA